MSKPARSSRVLRFGLYEADLDAAELRKDGLKVKLQARPFDVLCILLERPGEVVSREEFRQRLWPADTFVDFDHSLNASVNKLRQALGDDADNPRFVATSGRRGYRFIAPVHASSNGNSLIETSTSAIQEETALAGSTRGEISKPAGTSRIVRTTAILAGSAAALLAAFLVFRWLAPLPPPRVVQIAQLTNSGRADDWGGIVSDGARVYFLEREGGHWTGMQTSINGGETRTVGTDFRNMKILDYSPSRAEFLVGSFDRRWDEQMAVWTAPAQGGALRRVGDLKVGDAAWTKDGEGIIFSREEGIFEADKDGSRARKLATPKSIAGSFTWSPDGSRLRFEIFDQDVGVSRLWEIKADGSDLHAVVLNSSGFDYVSRGKWSSSGDYFIFTGVRDQQSAIWALREKGSLFHRQEETPVRLTAGPVDMFNPVPSRDEKRIFVLGGGAADVLMRYDAKSSQLKIPFTWVRPSGWVSFSRDGQVAYCLGPQFGLWRSRTDGTDRLALTPPNLMAGRPAWSPDGSRIAFQAERKGELSKIYWIPAKGGASEPAPQTVGNQREPDWSPDGKYVMFNVQPEKGLVSVEQSGVFHWDLSSSEITKLPGSENLIGARWSPNGRFIAAIDFEQTKLLIYDAADRAWKELAKGSLLGDPVWSPDGKYIYIQDVLKEEEPVYRLRLADQHRESLPGCDVALREGMQRCIFLGLAPDGSLLLNLRQSFFNVYALDFESGK